MENCNLNLRLRLKINKIHRVLEFNQSQRLKQHIEFNTQKEQKQKKVMTKALCKLMNNDIYKKAIESM